MPATFFSSTSRGGEDLGWLKTNYSYSFAHYYDPERMGFGALRVVNDDWIAPGAGFPTHGHQNMEIITIPLLGSLAHQDDAGGKGVIGVGQVQVMSAGTGVLHSEFNASKTEPSALFQIWIEPNQYHVKPRYQEAEYTLDGEKTGSILLVGPQTESATWIHQEAFISRITILAGEEFRYPLYRPENGVYLLVITGQGTTLDHTLNTRDALEVIQEQEITVKAVEKMEILCIEVPL